MLNKEDYLKYMRDFTSFSLEELTNIKDLIDIELSTRLVDKNDMYDFEMYE